MVDRVLITDADDFLGPSTVERFTNSGAAVTAVTEPLQSRDDAFSLAEHYGPFDIVVANLEAPISVAPITEHTDAICTSMFDRLVHPLFWLFAACLPSMVSAGRGAVVVPTSATALRTSSHPIAAYEAARTAQTTLVRSVGWEMAPNGVRVNGVAPNFIENPSYFPPEVVADETFRRDLQRAVLAGRLGRGDEAAATIEWLASPHASYIFGAIIPVDGGWSLG